LTELFEKSKKVDVFWDTVYINHQFISNCSQLHQKTKQNTVFYGYVLTDKLITGLVLMTNNNQKMKGQLESLIQQYTGYRVSLGCPRKTRGSVVWV